MIFRWARRTPRDIRRFALEEIGDEDLVLVVFVGGRQDVCTLDGLWEVSKNIVDKEDCLGGS